MDTLQNVRNCSTAFNFVTNANPVELSAAIARGFLQRVKSETKRDNLDTTADKMHL